MKKISELLPNLTNFGYIKLKIMSFFLLIIKIINFTGQMIQENIRYSYSFFDKFSIEAKMPNSNDIVLKSRDSEQFILMKQIQVTPDQYYETLATLEYQKMLSHEQLLGLVDYHPQPSIHKFIVLYEHCKISLNDQFQNRLTQNRSFEQPQLWSIFTSLVLGLAYLQQKNVGHGSVSLNDCYLNEQGFIKISDPTCATSSPYTLQKGYFYSPELMRCLASQSSQQLNIFKSDVFSLGCCMMKLSLMDHISEIFNYQQGLVNEKQLSDRVNELKSKGYSIQYVNFVISALELEEKNRYDFLRLKTQIFNLLSLDISEQKDEVMIQSYGGIKSSISSVYRSKQCPYFKEASSPMGINMNQQVEGSLNQNTNLQVLLNFSEKQIRRINEIQLSNQVMSQLADFTFFKDKPNVQYLFGNMKKSIDLGNEQLETKEDERKETIGEQTQNMLLNNQNFSNGNLQQNRGVDRMKKILQPIEDITGFQFTGEIKRRTKDDRSTRGHSRQPSSNDMENKNSHLWKQQQDHHISQKAKIIKRQVDKLFSDLCGEKQSEDLKQNKPPQNIKLKKKSTPQQYTDPTFLKMMQADVEKILQKRKLQPE